MQPTESRKMNYDIKNKKEILGLKAHRGPILCLERTMVQIFQSDHYVF